MEMQVEKRFPEISWRTYLRILALSRALTSPSLSNNEPLSKIIETSFSSSYHTLRDLEMRYQSLVSGHALRPCGDVEVQCKAPSITK